MPELLEIESYHRHALQVVGHTIAGFDTPDPNYLRGRPLDGAESLLVGEEVTGTRRIGKVLFLDTDAATIALRFGMTGRLLIDGASSIDELEYSSNRNDPAWIRFRMIVGPHRVEIIDPRRLGWVEVDMDESALGPDAWAIDTVRVGAVLDSSVAIKSRLMDQRRIAGLGNLLTDDILWRAGVDPHRASNGLLGEEVDAVATAIRSSLDDLWVRGGSHTGELQAERHDNGRCPADGAPLERSTIGGRTAYWCPLHQR